MEARLSADIRRRIVEETVIASPRSCPEIRLRLITEACPLFSKSDEEARALGFDDPYWAFCWGGGEVLARYLLDHPTWVKGKQVFDFGSGSGIVAIAAARSGASRVVACDTDPVALSAIELNAELNRAQVETQLEDPIGMSLEGFEMVLVGDMFYDPALASRALAWLTHLREEGREILFGDPDRGHLPRERIELLSTYEVESDVKQGALTWASVSRLR